MFAPVDNESSGGLTSDFWEGCKPPVFVGICLNHRMSSPAFLKSFLPWVAQRTSRLMILVFDYLERHNEVVFNGLSEAEAIDRVMKRGRSVEQTCRETLASSSLRAGDTLEILSFRAGIDSQEYKRLRQIVATASAENREFAADLQSAANDFVSRMQDAKPKRFQNHTPQCDLHRLEEYLLEEIAMYVRLFYLGYSVEVYPGPDSPLLQNIANGKYDLFPEYATRTHVSVIEKGRQQ